MLSKSGLIRVILVIFVALFCLDNICAQAARTYTNNRGKKVNFPLGELSFADELVSFEKGKPASAEKFSDPNQALNIPDYINDNQTPIRSVTLGCGGNLTLRFVDNALVDVPGPDLYVFEVGPSIEATDLSISKDGESWINIGRITGGTAEIDISRFVKPGEVFHYVRLTDIKSDCGGRFPGADIDAVGAIGSAIRISLNTSVLFNFNKYTLKPEAQKMLHEAALKIKQYPGANLVIEGHTDNTGSVEYNQELSKNRALSVKNYLVAGEGLKDLAVKIQGYGKSRPIASNDTEEGRERNRRVEIIVVPIGK
jgi:OmpA-OmpF porin, OOP family